jgi:hypothetical protein
MTSKKTVVARKTFNGVSVVYELEGDRVFAVASCPHCAHTESAVHLSADPGATVAAKVKKHMQEKH